MRKNSYTAPGIGAPSLLLILVVLSLSILAALTLMSARSDARLSERSAQVTEAVYTVYGETEEILASVDALVRSGREKSGSEEEFYEYICKNLPEGVAFEQNMLYIKGTDGIREVTLSVRPNFTGSKRLSIHTHELHAVTEDEWN